MNERSFLFLVASTREAGVIGNTETLARRAAQSVPSGVSQTWLHLAALAMGPFEDHRHDHGTYPMPDGDTRVLLDATLAATDIVFVSPVYWYSAPAPLKLYLDHWSAWMRVPGLDFKSRMSGKRLSMVCTSGDIVKSQPLFDSVRYSAEFLAMAWQGVLWGKGGAPGTVQGDAQAWAAAPAFLCSVAEAKTA